ncbi:hypothetical protein HNP46_000269 [Pseudomonas nitritireducens]|uniref:Uncharacterized protein n=1 Tax=Pseudomonas nitroreducens TaxID=46680 RepID=A0A7W7NY94_PSENT|nr:hypothetical protein [Pseudomonas nitritireducens]MBB4861458.1 hypothetical protein [Pseudomonas nitritireducens]
MEKKYPITIKFSDVEIAILMHRLTVLRDGSLEDVFEDEPGEEPRNFDMEAGKAFCEAAIQVFDGGGKALTIESETAEDVIVECLEGSTYAGAIIGLVEDDEAAESVKAVKKFARRLEKVLGCEIIEITY